MPRVKRNKHRNPTAWRRGVRCQGRLRANADVPGLIGRLCSTEGRQSVSTLVFEDKRPFQNYSGQLLTYLGGGGSDETILRLRLAPLARLQHAEHALNADAAADRRHVLAAEHAHQLVVPAGAVGVFSRVVGFQVPGLNTPTRLSSRQSVYKRQIIASCFASDDGAPKQEHIACAACRAES